MGRTRFERLVDREQENNYKQCALVKYSGIDVR